MIIHFYFPTFVNVLRSPTEQNTWPQSTEQPGLPSSLSAWLHDYCLAHNPAQEIQCQTLPEPSCRPTGWQLGGDKKVEEVMQAECLALLSGVMLAGFGARVSECHSNYPCSLSGRYTYCFLSLSSLSYCLVTFPFHSPPPLSLPHIDISESCLCYED